jgi:biopolymer transport protein ExbD
MLLPRTSRRRAVIGLTPLIDVVFLLLVFFILAGQFIEERGRLTLAEAAGGERSQTARPYLLVQIQTRDMVDLAGERLDIAGLIERLERVAAKREKPIVAIAPIEGLELGAMVAVVDALRAAGFSDFTFLPQ